MIFFIASPRSNGFDGKGYIVYGEASIGGTGTLNLVGLLPSEVAIIEGNNGAGLGLTGFISGGVGDVNGDGINDIGVSTLQGFSHSTAFVIFGGSNLSASGPIDLLNLTPDQGFTISGTPVFPSTINSFDTAGDLNGDGIDDIIISYQYGSNSSTVIVFGGNFTGAISHLGD